MFTCVCVRVCTHVCARAHCWCLAKSTGSPAQAVVTELWALPSCWGEPAPGWPGFGVKQVSQAATPAGSVTVTQWLSFFKVLFASPGYPPLRLLLSRRDFYLRHLFPMSSWPWPPVLLKRPPCGGTLLQMMLLTHAHGGANKRLAEKRSEPEKVARTRVRAVATDTRWGVTGASGF